MPTKKTDKKKRTKPAVDEWIASWPDWERDAAEAILRKEMTPGSFKENGNV